MAISVVGTNTYNSTGVATTIPIVLPSGIQNGDVGYVIIVREGYDDTLTAASGWTALGTKVSAFSPNRTTLAFEKTLSSGDSGATVNFGTSGTTADVSASVIVLRNVAARNSYVFDTRVSTNGRYGTTTPTVANPFLLGLYITGNAGSSVSPPTSWTEHVDTNNGATFSSGIQSIQTSSAANTATGTTTFSIGSSTAIDTYRIALEGSNSVSVTVDVDTPGISAASVDAEGFIPDAKIDVSTVTVSDVANDVTVSTGTSVTMDTPGVTFTGNDVTVETQTVSIATPTITDYRANVSGKANETDTTFTINSTYWGFFIFNQPADYNNDNLISATFRKTIESAGGTGVLEIAPITSYNSSDPRSSTFGTFQTIDGGFGAITTDVSAEFTANENIYGFAIRATGTRSVVVDATENATSGFRPLLTLAYDVPDLDVDLTVETPNITADALDVTQETGVIADTPSATGITFASEDVTVDAESNPDVDVSVDTAFTINVASVEAETIIRVFADADTATATLAANDVTTEVSIGVTVQLDTPNTQARAVLLASVNDETIVVAEDEDRYFISTMRTLQGRAPALPGGFSSQNQETGIDPSMQYWFRFNERVGTTAWNRLYAVNDAGVPVGRASLWLNNVTIGQNNGPDGRHNFYFNGDAFAMQNMPAFRDETWYFPSSLEFTFRTERKTQFLMGGSDMRYALSSENAPPWELWLEDGMLELRQYNWDGTENPTLTIKARTDLADGEWHHVVLQNSSQNQSGFTSFTGVERFFAFETFVDGHLELRRRTGSVAQGFPDYIAARPDQYYGLGISAPVLAKSHWFLGDMTEVVFRNGRVLSEDEITEQRDNVMGIDTIRPDTAEAIRVNAYDASGRGNKPRLLVLHFSPERPLYQSGMRFPLTSQFRAAYNDPNFVGTYGQDENYIDVAFQGFGEAAGVFGRADGGGIFQMFHEAVRGRNSDVTGRYVSDEDAYKDAITDDYRLVDLESDLNMDDYDVISVVGFPKNGNDWFYYDQMDEVNATTAKPGRRQLEDLVEQVKQQAITNRKGIFINDPAAAMAFGIVDKVEVIPNVMENIALDRRLGAVTNIFDYRSAEVDPFNGAKPDEGPNISVTINEASRYEDTHANIRQRVRSLVHGLTDLSGWIKSSEVRWWNLNPMGNPPYQISRHYDDRMNGLQLGDDFFLSGAYWDEEAVWGEYQKNLERELAWVASPVNSVKVGTAVTSFSPIYYNGNDPTGNPYYDYAVSIAVQPGDSWDGQEVTGKVYVNFTEAYTQWADRWQGEKIQKLTSRGWPADESVGLGDTIKFPDGATWTVNAQHLFYQFSTHYGDNIGSEVNLPVTGGSGPDWGWSPGGSRGGTGQGGLGAGEAMQYRWRSFFDLEAIPVPTMANRAIRWLTTDLDVGGTARVDAGTSEPVLAEANDVTVETSISVETYVTTARADVRANSDIDATSRDAIVVTSTAEIDVNGVAPITDIELDTAHVTVIANETDSADLVIDWSDTLVLTMPRQAITLILEDN